MALNVDTFTGGLFETNCFYLPSARLLVDAPEETAGWLRSKGYAVESLLLTHGHIDHVWDAAQIQKQHACRVFYHRDTWPMISDPGFFKRYGMAWEVDPVAAGVELGAVDSWEVAGVEFQVLEVPGHCPGSLCFLEKSERVLFGGDVLFANGVGRWDLPGGDRDLLLSGIRDKILPLGDDVCVLPGHGPSTTVGRERVGNPYLQ